MRGQAARSRTLPLAPRGATAPLGARALPRTDPFRLQDVPQPPPPTFSARRFTPRSEVRRFGDTELEIIERPAETLGPAVPFALIEIIRLTAENTPYHAGTYMHRHLAQATRLVVIRKDGAVEGVSIATEFDLQGRRSLFLNASMYSPAIRGSQMAARINQLHIWRAVWAAFPRSVFVAFRTQNPLVLSTAVSSAAFFPRWDQPVPRRVRQVAEALSQALNPGATFDAEALVQRGALARDFRDPDQPRHHNPAVNDFCDRHLDYARGDLFLAVAEMNLAAIARCAWRNWRKVRARARSRALR